MRTCGSIVMLLVLACGHPPRPPAGGSAVSAPDAGVAARGAAPTGPAIDAAPASPTKDECVALLGHVFDVANAARKEPLGTDESAAVRSKMITDNLASCLATHRATYECAMKATTPAELQVCPE
jgi:hypothetical protein